MRQLRRRKTTHNYLIQVGILYIGKYLLFFFTFLAVVFVLLVLMFFKRFNGKNINV